MRYDHLFRSKALREVWVDLPYGTGEDYFAISMTVWVADISLFIYGKFFYMGWKNLIYA